MGKQIWGFVHFIKYEGKYDSQNMLKCLAIALSSWFSQIVHQQKLFFGYDKCLKTLSPWN